MAALGIDPSCRKTYEASLPEYICPEAVFAADLPGKIDCSVLKEEFLLGGTKQLKNKLLYFFGRHNLACGILEVSENPQFRRLADLEMQVACLCLYCCLKILIYFRLAVELYVGVYGLTFCHIY